MPGKKLTKAMILAAGYGTRLKPHTDVLPKALVQYNNKPMIEHVILKLISAGIEDITVNVHYLPEKVFDYFKANEFDAKINLTFEPEILGTGGGIKNARNFLSGSGNFIVHNADVDSGIDIAELFNRHINSDVLATLCVKKRETSRPVLVDNSNYLCGRIYKGETKLYKETLSYSETSFCGVSVFSDRVFELFPDTENFDIALFLFEMIRNGEKVLCYDIGDTYWKDLGKFEDLNADIPHK